MIRLLTNLTESVEDVQDPQLHEWVNQEQCYTIVQGPC